MIEDMQALSGPGPGAELVAHLGPMLERLAARPPAGQRQRARWAEWSRRAQDPESAPEPDETPPAGIPMPRGRDGRPAAVSPEDLLALFDAQVTSRWLDVAALRMRAAGQGAPHVGSAGREGVAALALALRATDPALPAHPPGAFHLARAAQAGRQGAVADLAAALSIGRPASGRGLDPERDLASVPLRTAPGAAHLPRALGIAWALGRQGRGRPRDAVRLSWPDDSIAVAGLGAMDANLASATVTLNAACWAALQKLPLPLLFVCEDDGSSALRVPRDWLRTLYDGRPGLHYLFADTGGDPGTLLATAREAAELARSEKTPVMLHLAAVQIGTDPGPGADPPDLGRDPLAATMEALVARGVLDGAAVGAMFVEARDRVAAAVEEVAGARPPRGRRVAGTLTGGISLPGVDRVAVRAGRSPDPAARLQAFGDRLPEYGPSLTLAGTLNRALLDAAVITPRLVVVGPEVGRLGGGHGVTGGLQRRLGVTRVVDMLPDEQTLLGLALGAGAAGLLPVVELPHLGALHRAAEEVRAQIRLDPEVPGVPMVLRVPWFAGVPTDDPAAADLGAGVLRDLPGVVVACAAHPVGAAALLRSLLAVADVEGRTCILLEPVRLYHEHDLGADGDGDWLAPYADPDLWHAEHVPVGRVSVWGSGIDLTIASFGSGLRRALRAAETLNRAGIGVRVVDLRWLSPLPIDELMREADLTGRLLLVDESRRTGGVSEGLVTALLEGGFDGSLARVTSADPADHPDLPASRLLPTQDEIEDTARALCETPSSP